MKPSKDDIHIQVPNKSKSTSTQVQSDITKELLSFGWSQHEQTPFLWRNEDIQLYPQYIQTHEAIQIHQELKQGLTIEGWIC